ncbi:hypothetical protein AVEN_206096-1, partial [Araneus ventricosus]
LSPRKKRKFRNYVDSSDEEEISPSNYPTVTEEKHCASCSVKKTPLWRDAEDGTPLCNACGIRVNQSFDQYLSVHKDSFNNPPTNRRLEEAAVLRWLR